MNRYGGAKRDALGASYEHQPDAFYYHNRDIPTFLPTLRKYDGFLIFVLLLLDLLQKSAIPIALYDKSYFVIFGGMFAIILYFLVVEALRGNIFPSIFAGAYVGFLVIECFSYQAIARQPANVNAIAPYLTLLTFIPLVVHSKSSEYPLRALFWIALCYATLYVVLNPYLVERFNATDKSLILRDSIRDPRVVLANSLNSFVLFYALCNLRKRPIISVFAILISGSAIYLAQSRFYTFVVILVVLIAVLCYAAPAMRRIFGFGCAAVFTALCIYGVSGYFGQPTNPYEMLFTDHSGAARYLEYRAALTHFSDDRLLFGMGIPPSTEMIQQFVKSMAPFYTADLGAAGIFFNFGIFGFAVFLFLSLFLILAFPKRWNRSPDRLALYYAGVASAMIGFFAAQIVGGSGTMIAALVIATIIRENPSSAVGMLFVARKRKLPRNHSESLTSPAHSV